MSSVGNAEHTVVELRRQLAEAEETLRAIRRGEVDALVIGHADGDEIFTIEGNSDSYRSFMEVMEPGAAALDQHGRLLYANHALLELLSLPLEALQGKPLDVAFGPPLASELGDLLSLQSQEQHSRDIRIGSPDGVERQFIASVAPLRIGTINGFALTLTDVTARARAEAAEQSERAARAVIASANEAVVVCDKNGVVTHANAAARAICDCDPVGQTFANAIPLIFPHATGVMGAEDVVSLTIAGTATRGLEAVAQSSPGVKDFLLSAAPLRATGDQISGCVITLVDLSQRKAAEKQQLLLMGELDHRVKNTLALVLSISSRTLSNEETLEGFQHAFTGRIRALAATHTLLADSSWTNLTIERVVESELAPYVDVDGGRVSFVGLQPSITPRAAIALGLVIHELATNAVKYGALSTERGRIVVRALPREEDMTAPVRIEWRESGGPPVQEPRRAGFGRTVIQRSLQYSSQGGAEIEFASDGVICRISIPGSDVH